MTRTNYLKKTLGFFYQLCFITSLFIMSGFSQSALAEGVFEKKQKANHALFGAQLNNIKAEHQLKFGKSKGNGAGRKSDNPWNKKKQKNQRSFTKAEWGECRDYALLKRNRCYREGRNAYRCEQMYETRTRLCDNDF